MAIQLTSPTYAGRRLRIAGVTVAFDENGIADRVVARGLEETDEPISEADVRAFEPLAPVVERAPKQTRKKAAAEC